MPNGDKEVLVIHPLEAYVYEDTDKIPLRDGRFINGNTGTIIRARLTVDDYIAVVKDYVPNDEPKKSIRLESPKYTGPVVALDFDEPSRTVWFTRGAD